MTASNSFPRQALFISHATPEDNDFVRWLGAKLSAMGYEVWADMAQFHGGLDWSRKLEEALHKRAVKMLVVCTEKGIDKQGVRNEIELGSVIGKNLNDEAFIIPLRLESYQSPFRIAHLQYIDFKYSWIKGFLELVNLLLENDIPRDHPSNMKMWMDSQSEGSSQLLTKPEPLVSNWLEVDKLPQSINYCEAPVGFDLKLFQFRQNHVWPVVPYRNGVITFSSPDTQGSMGNNLPGRLVGSIDTSIFLKNGWEENGIAQYHATRILADISVQAFDNYCIKRGLKGYSGSGNKISWWGDIKTAPLDRVKFDWGFNRGSRQIIGHSPKRKIHWHYAINAQLRHQPLLHLRISSRLVFSENGLDALEDVRKAHTLRRSFAKGWRNARWRDMLSAFLWWVSDDKRTLRLEVGKAIYLSAFIPSMQFSCPVRVDETDVIVDEDDPDVPDVPLEEWVDEISNGDTE